MSIVVVERIRNIIVQGSGINGTNGVDGSDGQGVPIGGTTTQKLVKASAADFDTEWVDDAPVGGGALVAYKTIDESITSDITLSLDTDLQVTLEASSYYRIEISIMRTSNILADFAISFTVPTSSQGGYRRSISDSDVLFDITSASANPLNSVSSTSLERVILFGWIKTTSAGTFGLNWAQKSTHFTATTLKEGSYIILNKLN